MKTSWEVEFDKEFTREDGLIDKYSYYGIEDDAFSPRTMPDAIKDFIRAVVKEEKKKWLKERKSE